MRTTFIMFFIILSAGVSATDTYANNSYGTGTYGMGTVTTSSTTTTISTPSGGGTVNVAEGSLEKPSDKLRQTVLIDIIEAYKPMTIKITNEEIGIKKMVLVTKTTAKDVKLAVERLPYGPNGIPPFPGPKVANASYAIYSFFNISHTNLEDSLELVKIEFTVNKSWIDVGGYENGQIKLSRLSGSWTELSAVFIGEDEKRLFFESESPGLSIFAVSAKTVFEEESTPYLKTSSRNATIVEKEMGSKTGFNEGFVSTYFRYIAGFLIAASLFTLTRIMVPYYRITRSLRRLRKEERMRVKKKMAAENQYFSRAIDENMFNKTMSEEQDKLTELRTQIAIEKKRMKNLIARLSFSYLVSWPLAKSRIIYEKVRRFVKAVFGTETGGGGAKR